MASEYTQNYNLDLYVDSDKPNLRDQYNGAMRKVDAQLLVQSNAMSNTNTAVGNLATSVTTMQTQVTANKAASEKNTSDIATLSTKVNDIDTTTNGLSNTVAEHTTQIEANTTAITGNGQLIQAANTEISNEIVRAKAAESRIEDKVDTETTRATNAETQLSGRITANENAIAELQDGGGTVTPSASVTAFTEADCKLDTGINASSSRIHGFWDSVNKVLALNFYIVVSSPTSGAGVTLPSFVEAPATEFNITDGCSASAGYLASSSNWAQRNTRITTDRKFICTNYGAINGSAMTEFVGTNVVCLRNVLPSA